jgi:hypothetical protein
MEAVALDLEVGKMVLVEVVETQPKQLRTVRAAAAATAATQKEAGEKFQQ